MGDFGAKGSVPGYDVRSIIDYLQQFNSSWPLLKQQESSIFSGTVSHNLGYPPFHFITTADGRVEQFAPFSVDANTLTRDAGTDTPRYFIFRLPLDQNFTASTVSGDTTVSTVNDDFGFKVAKPGANIDSDDMRDFSLHSSTRSPMIHMVNNGTMVNTGGGLGYERTVTHGLGYIPIVFVFIKPSTNIIGLPVGRYTITRPAVGVGSEYFSVSSTSVYITADEGFAYTAPPDVSVVVLKEPFNKETVNVSFP